MKKRVEPLNESPASRAAAPTKPPSKSGGKSNGMAITRRRQDPNASEDVAPDRHSVLERTLERYPWAKLSDDRGNQGQLRLLLDAAGEEGRAWMVVPEEGQRIPGPFDADIYVALGQLYNDQIPMDRRDTQRTVHTSLGELAAVMQRERGGTTYAAIRTGLERLGATRIRAVRTWKDGDVVAEEKLFSIVDSITYRYRRSSDTAATSVAVRFSEDVAESIARGHFRLLNVSRYFALPLPTARRLYRYLDLRRWRGRTQLDELALPLRQLAEELPIERDAPSHIKRTLDPAHIALVASGYLAAADYEERTVPGKKRPAIWVRYQFATSTVETGPPAELEFTPTPPALDEVIPKRDRADDQVNQRRDQGRATEGVDDLRELVSACLEVLRDEHSTAFYVKCATVLGREPFLNVLGGVRQMLQEGSTLELARKTFTATARKRAQAMGRSL